MHPLEAILRLCATAAPNPWFPRDYAKTAGVSLQQLSQLLELLYLDGLVRKAPGTAGAETGFLLTVEGQRVLEDPEALERLRNGEPLVPGDRGATVRRLLGRPVRPLVTWLLLAANFLVFGYGAYLAFTRQPPIKAYLDLLPTNNAGVSYITHQIGSLHGSDLLRGEWWRLMSCCFVHFGLLHILMNMYGLYAVGRTVETMWGHGWFLVLYLLSGLGGSCLGIAYQPGANNAGASGALCGLVGAIAVWVLLNGRFLPRALASRWRSGLLTTFVLMVFISLFPNVSAAAHLGGALAGGAAALLLNFHRFSPAPWRWLALLGLAAIPWACFAALERARATSNDWHQVEEMDFEQRFLTPGSPTNLRKIMYSANWFYQNNVRPLLDQRPERRDPEALERGLSSLDEQGQALHDLEKTLAQTGPYRDAEVEEARQAGLAYVRARARLLELADRCLREGEQWTAEEEKALKEQIATLAQARRAWEELLKK
jgi:membrane associated rhomboid family serine protease